LTPLAITGSPLIALVKQSSDTASLGALYATLADLYFACGRYAEELQAAERASELASAKGDAPIHARAEVSRGLALIAIGCPDDALPILEQAVPLLLE